MTIFFKNKNFRQFSLAELLSGAGDSLFYIALITYASKLNNYSLALSLIAITEALPKVLDTLAGYLADKTKKKFNYLIGLAIARFLLYLLVGLLFTKNIAGWHLVSIVIVINFISDSLGAYSNGLQTPLIADLVSQTEIADAIGFNGGISEIIAMVAQFIGSGLLLFMSYSGVAIINSITFLIAGLLFAEVGLRFSKRSQSINKQEFNQKSFLQTFRSAFHQVIKSKGLFTVTLIIALLNGIIGTIEPLIAIVIASNRTTMIIFTYSFTIAIVSAAVSCGIILGSIFGPQLFKKVSIFTLSSISTIISACSIMMIILKQIYACLPFLLFLGFFIGAISPKMTQWLFSTVDKTILASSMGLLNTILIISAPTTTAIITSIAASTNVNDALYLLFIISIIVLFIILYTTNKIKRIEQ